MSFVLRFLSPFLAVLTFVFKIMVLWMVVSLSSLMCLLGKITCWLLYIGPWFGGFFFALFFEILLVHEIPESGNHC